MYHISITYAVGEKHLSLFYSLAIMSRAAMTMVEQVSVEQDVNSIEH